MITAHESASSPLNLGCLRLCCRGVLDAGPRQARWSFVGLLLKRSWCYWPGPAGPVGPHLQQFHPLFLHNHALQDKNLVVWAEQQAGVEEEMFVQHRT